MNRILNWVVLFVLVFLSFLTAAEISDDVMDTLIFNDRQFYSNDSKILRRRESKLLELNFLGVAVNAPKYIATNVHSVLPLILAVRQTGERNWDVKFSKNCILTAFNLDTGDIFFKPLFGSKKRKAKPHNRKKPLPSSLEGEHTQFIKFDVRKKLSIPWDTGNWKFGVLNYDQFSNTVLVKLGTHKSKSNGDLTVLENTKSAATFSIQPLRENGRQQLIVNLDYTVTSRNFYSVSNGIPVTIVLLALDQRHPIHYDGVIPLKESSLQPGMKIQDNYMFDAMSFKNGHTLNSGTYVAYVVIDGAIVGSHPLVIDT